MAENESLRKNVEDMIEMVNTKEKECARLTEEHAGLEKQIQQLQSIHDAAAHTKSVIDHEMARIKVRLNSS